MPVPRKRALDLALSLENASSYPHFDRIAVRTPRRTFATFGLRGDDVNFAFDLALQEQFCARAPHAIAPVEGGWGRMGWTQCDLAAVDLATFKAALLAAHARSNVTRATNARPRASASSPPKKQTSQTKARASKQTPAKASKSRAPRSAKSESDVRSRPRRAPRVRKGM